MARPSDTLLIACGALAREITSLIEANGWNHLTVQCLPAILHNRPSEIPDRVRQKIRETKHKYEKVLVVYGDCGTGGLLDQVLEEEGIERIDGPHCYQFFTGAEDFQALNDADPTTFYLTDFLVRHFDRLVMGGLGIDRHPELLEIYFGNYTRLLYLAQTEDPDLVSQAEKAAGKLGLSYAYRFTGMTELGQFMAAANEGDDSDGQADGAVLA